MSKMKIKQTQTSNADLWVDEDSIVYITFKKRAYETAETLKENALAINSLNGNLGDNLVVCDIKNAIGVSREARNVSKALTYLYVYKAVAIVVENPLSRLIASFFVSFSTAGFPIKTFESSLKSKNWLTKYKVSNGNNKY
jgi:hypothetical protein